MRAAVLGGGPDRRRGGRGPPRPRPARHLRHPRGLVLPGGPRPERGDPRGRAPARARRRRATGGDASTRSCAETDGRIRAVRLAGGGEVAADLVVSTIGVVPNTGFLAGGALSARGERGDRDRRRPADVRPGRVGGRRLRERHVVRRLAPPGAALVHGPRPGPRGRPLDARRRRRLPPGHLVQLGQVLRPRVHDRGLRAGRASAPTATRSSLPRTCGPGSSGCRALREPAHRRRRATAWWASTCSARAGTTSRSSTGSTSGARSTGC